MLQPKIKNVLAMAPYQLKIWYETGEVKVFDATPYISGDWFGELRDKEYFKSVHVLPGGAGIEWRGGQDIAPHELYENSVPVA